MCVHITTELVPSRLFVQCLTLHNIIGFRLAQSKTNTPIFVLDYAEFCLHTLFLEQLAVLQVQASPATVHLQTQLYSVVQLYDIQAILLLQLQQVGRG